MPVLRMTWRQATRGATSRGGAHGRAQQQWVATMCLRASAREASRLSAAVIHEYGPYTLYDLDALPEEGKQYELADGWLTELSPSPWHDHASDRLKDIFRSAARQAGADVYVAGGPSDVSTPVGIRKPDVFIVSRDIACAAITRKARTSYASDLLLAVEVISPRSASEQVDRVRKMREYAQAGIPAYWIVDLEPEPKVAVFHLHDGSYALGAEVRAGQRVDVAQPFAVSFDPGSLTELD